MIPWRDWFLFAVLSLGLTPEDFWALTLSEWRFLAPEEGAALGRRELQRLVDLYPDEKAGTGNREPAIGSFDHD